MSVADFYRTELIKLNLEFEKINLFTKHPPTLGTYREQILKKYLRKFIPECLALKSGFVYNNENGNYDDLYASQTKQIDCMIFDALNYTPYLKDNDFEIICPEALYAGIEIKSNLTLFKSYSDKKKEDFPFKENRGKYYKWSGTLIDALLNIKSIWDNTMYKNKQVFLAIFAYSISFDPNTLFMAFDNNEIQRQLGINHMNQLPTYICAPNNYLIYFSQTAIDCSPDMGYDPYETEMSVIQPDKSDPGFALQFFTIALKMSIEYHLKNEIPDNKGLFSCGKGNIGLWSHHFQLNCD